MFRMFADKRKVAIAGLAFVALTAATFNAAGQRKPATGSIHRTAAAGLKTEVAQGYDGSQEYYEVGAENDSSAYPFNVYGIEGFVPNDVGGVGVLGYGEAAKAYGVYGVSFGTNGIGVYGSGDGPAPVANATPSSTQQSTGVVGNSQSGDGVYGSTEFPNGSNAGQVAGVMGVDNTTSGTDNDGIAGMTTNGGYGVVGLSSDADNASGTDQSAAGGLLGLATEGDGVDAYTNLGNAVYGDNVAPYAAVYGENDNTTAGSQAGVYGDSVGTGVWGESPTSNSGYAIGVVAQGADYEFVAYNSSGDSVFSVDPSGNIVNSGTVTSDSRTRDGYYAKTFTSRASSPTVEDVGTGQLSNGQGAVRLDPAFAGQIDRTTPYHVFITPDADTNGLYVASKTPAGFVVRETRGGHGTFSFDYRIVAAVDGQATTRATLSKVPVGPHARTMAKGSATSAKRSAMLRAFRAHQPIQTFVPQRNLAAEFRLH